MDLTSALKVPPSLYAQFLAEVHGQSAIEHDWGFATYEFGPDFVYLIDIYVVPQERTAKKGIQLMHEVQDAAKKIGITKMLGSVAIDSKEARKNYDMLKHLGFCDLRVDENTIYLIREF